MTKRPKVNSKGQVSDQDEIKKASRKAKIEEQKQNSELRKKVFKILGNRAVIWTGIIVIYAVIIVSLVSAAISIWGRYDNEWYGIATSIVIFLLGRFSNNNSK